MKCPPLTSRLNCSVYSRVLAPSSADGDEVHRGPLLRAKDSTSVKHNSDSWYVRHRPHPILLMVCLDDRKIRVASPRERSQAKSLKFTVTEERVVDDWLTPARHDRLNNVKDT